MQKSKKLISSKIQKAFLFQIIILVILFSGCRKDAKTVADKRWERKKLEAKLYDVPVLINAQLVQNINNTACVDESSIISYETPLDFNQACSYYQEEMERLGWWQSAAFKGTEALLNFEKPNKYCSVSIRPFKKTSRIIIFIGQKL